jgi:hypothetical protein
MDEFAQSRGDDDLFDDEIIPIESSSPTQQATTQLSQVTLSAQQVEHASDTFNPPQDHIQKPASQQQSHRGRGRGRGNPRGRGPSTRGPVPTDTSNLSLRGGQGLNNSKWSTQPPKAKRSDSSQEQPPQAPEATAVTAQEPSQPSNDSAAQVEDGAAPSTAPSGLSAKARPPAVRGDRSSTGGFAKPKLTEAELSAKLATAKQKSLDLAAAHARAQADADEFAERERAAGERRRREDGERKRLEGERERNRARKLGAREGREWDRDKEESQAKGFAPRPRAVEEEQADLSMYEWHEDRGRGRGRGGRGARGRDRGRGRGGRDAAAVSSTLRQKQPDIKAPEDFPALPASASKPVDTAVVAERKPAAPKLVDSDAAPAGGNWADEVENAAS